MAGWSDNDSPESPNREDQTFDQERSQEFDDHVERLIQDFQQQGGANILLRWLSSFHDVDAEDILQEGVTQLWRKYHHKLSPDATVKDVQRLLSKICKNLVYDHHRRTQKITWYSWRQPTQENEEDTIRKEIEQQWLRQQGIDEVGDAVCQAMHDRDVMKAVLQHFKKMEDKLCLLFMMQQMKPHEMVGYVSGSADSIRKRCQRIRERLLRELDLTSKEFDPDGG
jgi:DNA-directed RNA polymerase specialized sigma24 family protein